MTLTARVANLSALVVALSLTTAARAELLLYEPFNYTVGANLGGVDNDPDPMGPAGTPVGQSGSYAAGGSYTWYARGTTSNYQSNKDAVVSGGNLAYPGLAASQGASVSYGSALPNNGSDPNDPNNVFNRSLYADAIAFPAPIESGSLYASFIIRIKSEVENGGGSADRHAPVGLIADLANAGNAGAALAGQSGTGVSANGANFWMRRDPVDPTLTTSNFSPGKSSVDGIGPGAAGPTAGWQHSGLGANVESNQFGDLDGQPEPLFSDSNTWQTYFVVMKYEFDAQDPTATGQSDTVSLWMNPGAGTLGTATGEADASQAASGNLGSYYAALDAVGTATTDVTSINSFALIGHRQNTVETFAVDFDELRIGTTWQDVTPAATAEDDADFDGDGDVDGADFLTWQSHVGIAGDQPDGDADSDGQIDGEDLEVWKEQFFAASVVATSGAVPEPSSPLILTFAGLLAAMVSRRTA